MQHFVLRGKVLGKNSDSLFQEVLSVPRNSVTTLIEELNRMSRKARGLTTLPSSGFAEGVSRTVSHRFFVCFSEV